LVARRAHNPKVISSSLVPATWKKSHDTSVSWDFLFLVYSAEILGGNFAKKELHP